MEKKEGGLSTLLRRAAQREKWVVKARGQTFFNRENTCGGTEERHFESQQDAVFVHVGLGMPVKKRDTLVLLMLVRALCWSTRAFGI